MPETTNTNHIHIDATNEIDRWRYTCPHGHTLGKISAYNASYYCPTCARSHKIDTPTWTTIIDRRTGEEIPFSQVTYDGE